jgi:hypothetical protein
MAVTEIAAPSEADEAAFIRRVVGRPYDSHTFTCWHLVHQTQLELFGRELSVALPSGLSRMAEMRLILRHPERQRWRQVPRPGTGAIVMMKSGEYEAHAGVWLRPDRGAILHCASPHGTVYEPEHEILARGVRELVFYDPRY